MVYLKVSISDLLGENSIYEMVQIGKLEKNISPFLYRSFL